MNIFTRNAASQITNTGFTYDLNGNLTSDGTYTYVYDGENRLKEVKQGVNTIASYTYDYMGRRTASTESGGTIYFHYDGWNVVAETDASGVAVATYAYDDGDQPVSMTRGGNTYYYQYNAHGDVVSLTNNLGQVVNTYAYDPWGKVLASTEAVSNPYRYAGYRYDSTTGLYYLQRRYYMPDLFRFITSDSYPSELTNVQSLNSYSYVQNNPTNLIDPWGLVPPRNIPPGASIKRNIQEARKMSPIEFYSAVRTGGKWDYKNKKCGGGPQYEDFGNYNFGITGKAAGFYDMELLRFAGAYQIYMDWKLDRPKTGVGLPWGSNPYGDDPEDQKWTNEGINDAKMDLWDVISRRLSW